MIIHSPWAGFQQRIRSTDGKNYTLFNCNIDHLAMVTAMLDKSNTEFFLVQIFVIHNRHNNIVVFNIIIILVIMVTSFLWVLTEL